MKSTKKPLILSIFIVLLVFKISNVIMPPKHQFDQSRYNSGLQSDQVKIDLKDAAEEYRNSFLPEYLNQHNRHPPDLLENWFYFAKKNKCSLDGWFYRMIYEDLEPFRKIGGISNDMVERAKSMENVTLFEIKGGKLPENYQINRIIASLDQEKLPDLVLIYNKEDEPRILFRDPFESIKDIKDPEQFKIEKQKLINEFTAGGLEFNPEFSEFVGAGADATALMRKSSDPSIDLEKVFQLHAIVQGGNFRANTDLLPMFSKATAKGMFRDIVIPEFYHQWQPSPAKGELKDWDKKIDKMYWRGASTGGVSITWPVENNWRNFHRHRLVHQFGPLSNYSKDEIDIAFTNLIQCRGCAAMKEYVGEIPPRDSSDQKFEYKYLVDVDGNSFTERFLPLLRFNNLIFKMTIFRDFVTDRVEPKKHYLNVDLDYGNLISQLIWAKNNQREAKLIAERAAKHAQDHLRIEDMSCYTYRLMIEYASLLR